MTNNYKRILIIGIVLEKKYKFKINLLLPNKLIIFHNFDELDNWVLYIEREEERKYLSNVMLTPWQTYQYIQAIINDKIECRVYKDFVLASSLYKPNFK